MKRSYTFRFDGPSLAAIKNLSQLLSLRSVEHNVVSNGIISTSIPVPLFNWERKPNSSDNWVGVNPFMCLDRFKAAISDDNPTAKVMVSVSSFRAYRIIIPPLISAGTCWIDGEPIGRNLLGGTALLFGWLYILA